MPEAKSAMLTKKDVSSAGRPSPVVTMSGGVMMPTNMASVCWRATKHVSRSGGRASTPYTMPKRGRDEDTRKF
jgi:hypothetical protein